MILHPINQRLRMLDSHSHRERLRFHQNLLLVQQLINIPRRMPCRQNHRFPAKLPTILRRHSYQPLPRFQKLHHLRPKVNLTTRFPHRLPHRHHHLRQQVRANMRMRLHQNFLRCPMCHQRPINLRHRTALCRPRIKFPIRKRPSSAFTKTVIRFLDHPPLLQNWP